MKKLMSDEPNDRVPKVEIDVDGDEVDPDDEYRTYKLRLSTTLQLEERDQNKPDIEIEPGTDDWSTAIEGTILYGDGHHDDHVVGHVDARLMALHQIGDDTFGIMDADSQEMSDLHPHIFSKYAGVMTKALAKIYDPDGEDDMFCEPVLFVERIGVAIAHRGRGVGLLAMNALLDFYAGQCRIAICQPHPLTDEAEFRDAAYYDPVRSATPKATQQRALQKLWSRAGFRKIGRGPYYAVNLNRRR